MCKLLANFTAFVATDGLLLLSNNLHPHGVNEVYESRVASLSGGK